MFTDSFDPIDSQYSSQGDFFKGYNLNKNETESIDDLVESQADSLDINSLPNYNDSITNFFNQNDSSDFTDDIEEDSHNDFFDREYLKLRISDFFSEEIWCDKATKVFDAHCISNNTTDKNSCFIRQGDKVRVMISKKIAIDAINKDIEVISPFFVFDYEEIPTLITSYISFL